MQTLRQCLRWFLVAVCLGLLLAILFGVVGEFFIELARERGWYQSPSAQLDAGMTAFSQFVTQAWVLVLAALATGLTCGVWLDTLIRRREALDSGAGLSLALTADDSLWLAKISEKYARPSLDGLNQVVSGIFNQFAGTQEMLSITRATVSLAQKFMGHEIKALADVSGQGDAKIRADHSAEDLEIRLIRWLNRYENLWVSLLNIYQQRGLDVYEPQGLREWLAQDREMILELMSFADARKYLKLRVRLSEIGFAHLRFGLSPFIQD